MTTPTDRPNLDRLRSPISFAELAAIAQAQKAALTDVLDMADEWSALSWLPEFPTYEDFAKASPAQRTLWEAAENLRDAIRAHISETPASDAPAHLDLTNGAER